MKINGTSNNSLQNKVLLDTFIDQISALQTDVGNLQIADNNLANDIATKASTADIANAVSTNTLNAQNGNIKKLKVQGTGSSATIENATIGTASIGTENVTQSNITNLEVMDVDAGTVRAGTLTVENDATVSGDLSVQDISAKDITSASVNTLNLTAAESTVTDLQSDTANVTNKLTVKDLEVNGDFTGVSSIDTEDIDTDNIKAKTAEVTETLKAQNTRDWLSQVMNRTQILPTPSPQLEPIDRYTIELPRFNGVYLLSWENGNTVVWTATVIGNGKSYGISWGSRTEENFITDLFQYNGKLYIRINSNGALKCAYSATEELPNPTIYFNMVGWTQDKSLEELCDERSHLINEYHTGTAWFGHTFIPRLENVGGNGINFRGSCTFNNLPNLQNSQVGDVWNITDESFTDARFVEGAGQPINAGDDVVAVEAPQFENGADFEQIETPYSADTIEIDEYNRVIVNAANGNKILIQAGAYSTDGGQTWISKNYNNPNENNILVLSNGKILWNVDHSVYLSEDNGLSFNYLFEVSTGPIVELRNGKVYGFYEERMVDFGNKDELVLGDFVDIIPSGYIQKATVINNAIFIKTMSDATYLSTDDGQTWNLYSGTVDFSKSFISYYNEAEVSVRTEWIITKVVQFNNNYYLERWIDWYGRRAYYKTTDFENFYFIYDSIDGGPGDLPYISFTKNNITGISYGIDSNGNLFTSTDDGNTWTETTPYNVAYGFIYCDPTGTLWAGTTLRKSIDGGQTWQNIQLTPGRQPTITSVIEAPNGNLVAATDGIDRWISTDGGQTWQQHFEERYRILNPYIIDGKIWATSSWYDDEDKIGIITSENGIEWTVIDSQDVNLNTSFLQISIDEKGHIYYANRFSRDRGETWENINGPILESLVIFEKKILGVDSNFSSSAPYSIFYESVPSINKYLKWDKFAAGVNYNNFVATNITASGSIKVNNNDVLTTADKGVSNGVATLDATGRVPYSQLPAVVDTVADGNMNAVTSNAVYDYIDAAITQVLNTGF